MLRPRGHAGPTEAPSGIEDFMRTSTTYAFLATLLSSLSVAACGQLEGEPDKLPVIATIRGQLSNPNGYAAGPSMRVAIVWGRESGTIQVSQDVPVQPVFPSQFKLEVRDLPPALAMRAPRDKNDPSAPQAGCSPGYDPSKGAPPPSGTATCDPDAPPSAGPAPTPAAPPSAGGTRIQSDFRPATAADPFRVAVGTLVAYEDLNGNGQLDLLDENATQAIDRVVGVNEKLYVVYAEGTPTGELAQFGIPKGFSLLQIPECVGVATATSEPKVTTGGGTPTDTTQGQGTGTGTGGGNAPAAATEVPEDTATCDDIPHFQAIDTMFTLPLTAAARLSSFMCKGSGGFTSVESVSGGSSPAAPHSSPVAPPPDVAYPSPTDPSLYCRQDGTGYTYTKCDTAKLCGDTVCETALVARPENASASWPCPAH